MRLPVGTRHPQDAQAWISKYNPPGDDAQVLDRLSTLRHVTSQLYLPQSVPVAAGLDASVADGIWHDQ